MCSNNTVIVTNIIILYYALVLNIIIGCKIDSFVFI